LEHLHGGGPEDVDEAAMPVAWKTGMRSLSSGALLVGGEPWAAEGIGAAAALLAREERRGGRPPWMELRGGAGEEEGRGWPRRMAAGREVGGAGSGGASMGRGRRRCLGVV
jgi:hypothetical protein